MSKKEKLFWVILIISLSAILFGISYAIMLLTGKTYTAKEKYRYFEYGKTEFEADDITVTVEDEGLINITEQKTDKDAYLITMTSIPGKSGSTYITLSDSESVIHTFKIFVHESGIITKDSFFGDCSGDTIFSISIAIILGLLLFVLIRSFKLSSKENLYNYGNIALMGLIIYVSFAFIYQLTCIGDYQGLLRTIENIFDISFMFVLYSFPLAILMSLFVTVSNIVLLVKEGLNPRNLIGTFIGFSLIVAILFPALLEEFLYNQVMIVELHNPESLINFIVTFINCLLYQYVAFSECILVGTIIICIKAAKHIPEFNKDYIIILGCKMLKDGTPTKLLQGRIDRAVEFREMQKKATGKSIKFVPSGGKGSDEIISESECMKNYLISQGIPESDILSENSSTNTYENIKFSYDLIKNENKNAAIAYSTTNYHVMRAGLIASEQGINDIEGIGSKTKSYFWINAFFREFIATIVKERKLLLSVLVILFVFILVISGIYYISNVFFA